MNKPLPIRTRTEAEEALVATFDSASSNLRGASDLRAAAMARFVKSGLPDRRVESWHYTDLRSILRRAAPVRPGDFMPVERARAGLASAEAQTHAARIVMLDGIYRPDLSDLALLPAGVTVASLADALAEGDAEALGALTGEGQGADDPVVSLNTALMQDGVIVRVAAGVEAARPIAIANIMSGGAPHAAFVRSLVMVGDGAKLRLTETTAACDESETQVNEALVLRIGDNARVDYVSRVVRQGAGAISLHTLLATLGAGSEFNGFSFNPGVGVDRRQMFVRLNGRNSTLNLGGLSLLRGRQHADSTLVVDHAVPDCRSREFFRYILDDESTGVFQGKVVVRQHAQKTDGAMKSQAIMLGDGASMNNKPELEIFADDVVCGHGATVGQLDDDQIFYLQARGIPKPEAESLLLEAFAYEALELIADEQLRARFIEQTGEWLAARGAA
ncbi:MAG: Fe-S cluster assembly protein SufD [Hyphomicrobiales bacterium]|nr:Fe-S cluster assembly protein SufD [Hyphomicrobiales bacterium]